MKPTVKDTRAPVRKALPRMVAAVFPWPPKAEREAAIEAAQAQLLRAQHDRAEAERALAEAPLIAWLTAELARRRAERANADATAQGGAR